MCSEELTLVLIVFLYLLFREPELCTLLDVQVGLVSDVCDDCCSLRKVRTQ
jgi:hypothetical protein